MYVNVCIDFTTRSGSLIDYNTHYQMLGLYTSIDNLREHSPVAGQTTALCSVHSHNEKIKQSFQEVYSGWIGACRPDEARGDSEGTFIRFILATKRPSKALLMIPAVRCR